MKFVIILDKDRDAFPKDWPVIFESTSMEECVAAKQYSGNPMLIPKALARMELIQSKSLTDAANGRDEAGAIYREFDS